MADDGVASSAETATNASQNSSNELPEPIEHFEMMSEMIGSHLLTGSVHSNVVLSVLWCVLWCRTTRIQINRHKRNSSAVWAENKAGLVADGGDWIKSAAREFKILRKGLPEHLYVQVCEERLDLIRAYIAGPEGTPYDGGLFVFDIHLGSDYPQKPPSVLFWSFGRPINPNLYDSGKVCLSLLNTWRGRTEQMWTPGKSTLLQVSHACLDSAVCSPASVSIITSDCATGPGCCLIHCCWCCWCLSHLHCCTCCCLCHHLGLNCCH